MTLVAAAVVAACGAPDRRAPDGAAGAPAAPAPQADLLALRVPRAGGVARVLAWPAGDTALWTSPVPVPPVGAVLAFDDEDGAIAAADTGGHPLRIELRAGRVVTEKVRLAALRSADGWATFGVADRAARRLTPTGESWSIAFDRAPAAVVPTSDGSVLVVLDRADGAHVHRARPPAPRLGDSVVVPGARFAAATPLGDRLFFTSGAAVIGVRTRDLKPGGAVTLPGEPRALVASPSGDRLFALTGDGATLAVLDRYRDEVEATVTLPGIGTALRMDPFGRWLLVRGPADALWVMAVGDLKVAAQTTSLWRDDLPAVAADGTIARLVGADVEQWEPERGTTRRRIAGGADDRWYLFAWNGFRAPRRQDAPVEFAGAEADSLADSTRAPEPAPAGEASSDARPPAAPGPPAAPRAGFSVSFAAVTTQAAADSLVRAIVVNGQHPRVAPARVAGREVFRVVLGPFATRDAAVQAGRAARRDFFVFEEAP
jgi:cell division septation protein DedD